jgi:transcription antitermination protein NusB
MSEIEHEKLLKKPHRRHSREMAIQGLYAYKMTQNPLQQIFSDMKMLTEYDDYDEDFFKELISKTIKYEAAIDERIRIRSRNWEFARICLLDKIIMRMAICELVYFDDIPPRVAITEALEMAKVYSTADSHIFINGLLDRIYHDLIEEGRIFPPSKSKNDDENETKMETD